MRKKVWLSGIVGVVLLFIVLSSGGSYEAPFEVLDDVDVSPVEGVADSVVSIKETGWTVPVRLPVSDQGREDGPHITKDGRHLLFYYDPGVGAFAESGEGGNENDPKVYYSERPFLTKKVHPISEKDIFNVESGASLSDNGDIYYTKTFIKLFPTPHEASPFKTVINDGSQVIDMGTGKAEIDPYFCDATGELYASDVTEGEFTDQDILVYKNGVTTRLPAPINSKDTIDFQPFLTEDCQTMYFTSSRGAPSGSMFPLQVYRSERLGEFDWSEPTLFIAFPDDKVGGVGEFTMTRDEKQMVFLQLIITEVEGQYEGQNEIYYAERY